MLNIPALHRHCCVLEYMIAATKARQNLEDGLRHWERDIQLPC